MSEAATTNRPNMDLWNALEPEALGLFLDDKFAPTMIRFAALMASYKRFLSQTNNGITSETVAEKATDFAKMLRSHVKEVEEVRTAVKAPVLAAQRQIDGKGREQTEPLVAAAVEVEERRRVYLKAKDAELRRVAIEEAARKEAEMQALLDQATETGDKEVIEQAEEIAEEAAIALKTATAPVSDLTRIRSAFGTASLRDNWVWEKAVDDITQVDPTYLMINTKLADAAVRSGIRQIKGLRIYNDPK